MLFGYLNYLNDTPNVILNVINSIDSNNTPLIVGNILFVFVLILAIPLNLNPCRENFNNFLQSSCGLNYRENNVYHVGITILILFSAMVVSILVNSIVNIINVVAGFFAI